MAKETFAQVVTKQLTQLADASDDYTFRIKQSSIYRVPDSVKVLNSRAYSPLTVSFGPYHHGEYQLRSMELHKQRTLRLFLRRTGKSMESLVKYLIEDLQFFRESYEQLDESWEDVAFLKLMILDGCFMLEIIYSMNDFDDYYDENDPLFSYHGRKHTVPHIRRDMLCLENQLPMLVLQKLDAFRSNGKEDQMSIRRLMTDGWPYNNMGHSFGSWLHILDLHRKTLLYTSRVPKQDNRKEHSIYGSIPSAIGLSQAGILFRRSKTNSLRDICFKDSVLELPLLEVDDGLEAMFLNLMAFERLNVGTGSEVTSYVFFMACVITTERDVAFLRSKGIIENMIGSDVARLFNSISKDVTLDPESHLGYTYMKINDHCKMRWNHWRAGIIQTVHYFESTWAFLTLIAALIYFALTVAQTLYTVLSFYK